MLHHTPQYSTTTWTGSGEWKALLALDNDSVHRTQCHVCVASSSSGFSVLHIESTKSSTIHLTLDVIPLKDTAHHGHGSQYSQCDIKHYTHINTEHVCDKQLGVMSILVTNHITL